MTERKLHGTSFNVTAVKKGTKTEFVKMFGKRLGRRTDEVYYELTGKTPPKPKNKG